MLDLNTPAAQSRPRRVRPRRSHWAKSTLWERLGGDALPAILILLIVALPLAGIVPANPRWPGLPCILFGSGGACLLLVMLWRARQGDVKTRFIAWARRGPTPWLLALLGWHGVACLTALDHRFAVLGLIQMGAGVAVYVAASLLPQRRCRALLDALIGITILTSLLTILAASVGSGEALTAHDTHLVHYGLSHMSRLRTEVTAVSTTETGRNVIGGTFGDLHVLTTFLLLILPLLCIVVCSPTRPVRRLAAMAAMLAGLCALMFTQALFFAWPGRLGGMITLGMLHLRYLSPKREYPGQSKEAGARRTMRPASRKQKPARLREAVTRLPMGWTLTTTLVLLCFGWLLCHEPHPRLHSVLAGLVGSLIADYHTHAFVWAQGTGLPGLLLGAGFVLMVFLTGMRALRRQSASDSSLRRHLLVGAMAGIAAQVVETLINPVWQNSQPQFFLWLLLGLAQTWTAKA